MRSRNDQKVHQLVFDAELDDTWIPTARDAIARLNVVARGIAELALLRSVPMSFSFKSGVHKGKKRTCPCHSS